jgi:hypothetical protein
MAGGVNQDDALVGITHLILRARVSMAAKA